MIKTINFYSIRSLTNLHVGSGDNNYGVVDNLVQRDVNTNLPTIHSSSLKGALKEFFGYTDPSIISTVFGDSDHAGEWQFLSADLLSRPLRSDKLPYFHATSPEVLSGLAHKFANMGLDVPAGLQELAQLEVERDTPLVFNEAYREAIIEELDWQAEYRPTEASLDWISKVFGKNLVLVHNTDFRNLELPVIARNYLENGESKNLWYEEAVPYDTRFGVFIVQSENCEEAFNQALSNNVQIGANASIGYGLCKLTNESALLTPA
ncbi:MAG: type III-B CRISPR module RAMP protein Cmr4 [Bacteroidota bacterium]